MADKRGRKTGCPINIRDWLVELKETNSATYTTIYGLESLTRTQGSSTEDGSAETAVWEEPYITKRNQKFSFEGKRIIDALTGAVDPGQLLIEDYCTLAGCDADVELRLTDPYGHSTVHAVILTDFEESSDASSHTISFDAAQVGEADAVPYVQLASVALKDGETSLAGVLAMVIGDPAKIITVVHTPTTASNKRYKVANSNRAVVQVSNVTSTAFTITPLIAGTATLTITSVNNARTVTLEVTVTES